MRCAIVIVSLLLACAADRREPPLVERSIEGPTRLLDGADRARITSPWDPDALAKRPERGLAPRLTVDLRAVPPPDAVKVDSPPALCFVLPVVPTTPCLVEATPLADAARHDAASSPAAETQGDLVVLELQRAPTERARIEELVTRAAGRDLFVLAAHSVPAKREGAEPAGGVARLAFQTTPRTRGLLIALVDRDGARAGAGAAGFGSLKAWELPLARFVAMDGQRFVRKVALCEDRRRAVVAPAGTRIELPIPACPGAHVITLSYGVLEERRPGWGASPIRFTARIEGGGVPPREWLSTELAAASSPASHLWQESSVREEAARGAASLVLETSCEAACEDLALFAEPQIVPMFFPANVPPVIPPSVLLISLDTLRADRLGCYGYARADGRATSPCLDSFASGAIRFAQARSLAPWTLPSHATMFTGLAPPVHRVTRLGRVLSPEVHPLLAVDFARAGFATAAFTAGGFVAPEHGFDAGFDRYSTLDPFCSETHVERDLAPHPGDRPFNDAVRARYGREGVERWIDEQGGRPWFLFLHTYVIHDYFAPPDLERAFASRDDLSKLSSRDLLQLDRELVAKSVRPEPATIASLRDLYDADVAAADREVGALIDWLARSGRLDRTVVAIVSDHGEEHGEHGGLGHGHSLYEELLRVPFLLRVPGVAPRVVAEPVDLCDLAPTLREAAGLPPSSSCDGKSVLARLRDGDFRDAFWAEVGGSGWGRERALRVGDQKLLLRPPELEENVARRALRPDAWELYDLARDPGELDNVAPKARAGATPTAADLGAIGRRFEHEQSSWRARRAELVPDPARLERVQDAATRQRLEALGYVIPSIAEGDADDE